MGPADAAPRLAAGRRVPAFQSRVAELQDLVLARNNTPPLPLRTPSPSWALTRYSSLPSARGVPGDGDARPRLRGRVFDSVGVASAGHTQPPPGGPGRRSPGQGCRQNALICTRLFHKLLSVISRLSQL